MVSNPPPTSPPPRSLRGFACLGLDQPRYIENLGGVLRAAAVYEAAMIVVRAPRFADKTTDTTKVHRHIPLLMTDDLFSHLPLATTAVAVDFIKDAEPLHQYSHPERAFYIFGGENKTLDRKITSRCQDRVFIPTSVSMNLAATVNVVLYDRAAKRNQWPEKRIIRSAAGTKR